VNRCDVVTDEQESAQWRALIVAEVINRGQFPVSWRDLR
jgi:hypothetical protein